MSRKRAGILRFGELSIEGRSRAGDATWFRVNPPGLALDAGRGSLYLTGAEDLFLSHGHLDHSLGVPFLLSQRSSHQNASTRIFCPREIAEDLEAFIAASARLERRRYRYEIVPLEPGERARVGRDLDLEAFATDHIVPSLGFHLVRHRRRLARAYRGLPPARLIELREGGVETEETTEELWLSYCGDTTARVFDLEPRLFTSRILMIECTYIEGGERERGRRYGHLNLADLEARAELFRNDALVLHHLSRRHALDELARAVEERLPGLAGRVHLLPGDVGR